MTGVFDVKKALREEIEGLMTVREATVKTQRRAEARLGEAEEEVNTITKVRGFVDLEIARKREVLALEEEKDAQ